MLVLGCLVSLLVAAPVHAEAEGVEAYASLPELVRASDAVVLGQVIAAERGRSYSGCRVTAASLRIDEVLAGRVPGLSPVLTVEYFGGCGPSLPRLGREIPAERGVFFLRNKGVELRTIDPAVGQPEVDAEARFWRLAIRAGSAVDAGGRVHVPITDSAPFLAALDGHRFSELISAVRSAAPKVATGTGSAERPFDAALAAGVALTVVTLIIARVALRRRRSSA